MERNKSYDELKIEKYYNHTLTHTPFLKSRGLVVDGNNLIVIEEQGRLHSMYFVIGGGIENNETPEQAVIRECLEEANIKIETVGLIVTDKEHVKFNKFLCDIDCEKITYYFLCKYISGETKIQEGDEFENLQNKVKISRIPINQFMNIEIPLCVKEKLQKIYNKTTQTFDI